MAHPQSSPRGLWAKERIDVGANQITGNSTALVLSAGLTVSNAQTLTGNSTTLIVSGGIKVSNAQQLTANSTGFIAGNAASALPGNIDNGILWGIGSNTTGVFLFVNTTGTEHQYVNTTSVQPTAL